MIDPGITTYALNASMTMNTPNNIATISYARSAYPNFVGVGVPVIVGRCVIDRHPKACPTMGAGRNRELFACFGRLAVQPRSHIPPILPAVDLYYWVTRIWSTALSFDYMNFELRVRTTQDEF